MKKTFVGLFTALAMTFGVVGFAAPAAVAGPYTGTVDTDVKVRPRPAEPGKIAKVKVVIKTDGNGEPKGWITIIVRRAGKIVNTRVLRYSGDADVYKMGRFRKGEYRVTVKFDPRGTQSVYTQSKKKFSLTVG